MPILRHIANLWTFMGHPSLKSEWPLDKKLRAIKEAGFDGVCWAGSRELHEGCQRHGLIFVGGMASGKAKEFPRLLGDLEKFGAKHANVQLGDDEMLMPEALKLALALNREGKRLGLEPAVESHRGTCTETPEKTYQLADAYQRKTGELLPISWDFSHFAVVKHLVPANFIKRLLVRPDLVQRAQQFHFRPFNGHHVQVPITDGKGKLSPEFKDWLPFAEAVLKCWLAGNKRSGREIFICPELGPIEGGYALQTFPNSWEDAKILRREIDKLWNKVSG
ncbi:MAG TPA: xylose isomerase [Verrucomicrobiae bacterium]|jgi:sugar phosphate isomerase/epimerase